MFATTFLGHQGWMFQTDRAAVLVDPLLCDDFGAAHALEYRVWPPRVFDFAQFPRLDAVVLSHEHDDHFDLPSLAKLDRAIPVYLSARSSRAARRILETMGFTVHALVPGVPVRFGDLEVMPFAGDHIGVNCGDEWDTLPFLVRHVDGHGSMFSMVDITLTQRHVEWVAARAMKPGLVSWTNNALDWSHMADYLKERVEGTQQCFVKMGVGHKMIESFWGTPQAMITCAGGFAFTGERAWLNQRVFCVDTEKVCAMMQNVYKKEKFFSGVPGQTWILKAGKLAEVTPSQPWLSTAPVDTWASRAKAAVDVKDYAPGTGRRDLDDAGLARLRVQLDDFAGTLVGSVLFRGLASLLESEHPGLAGTFALALRTDKDKLVFEYDAPSCAFVARDRPCVAGLECWASDLLAVLEGEMGPISLTFGRSRVWNQLPSRLNFDIFEELHRTSHPLRRPDAYYRLYERLLAPARDVPPQIFRRT
jgi:hypothetical protein